MKSIDKKKENILIAFLILIIFFVGIVLSFKEELYLIVYLFGFVFFSAGTCVGLTAPPEGRFVLYTHGVTGLGMMVYIMTADLWSAPILSDLSTKLILLLFCNFLIYVSGLVFSTYYTKNEKIRNISYSRVIPFAIYAIAFLVSGLIKYYYF